MACSTCAARCPDTAARWSASAPPSARSEPPAARYDRKDRFHQRAKREGFRSRAAYKLEQIQRSHRLLRAGQRVADLGCWPGGWLQVAAAAVGPGGRVAGVDLAAIEPPIESANVIAFQGDLGEVAVLAELLAALGGPADVLLCDAAPKLSGVRDRDHANEEALLEAVERALPKLLRRGGDALVKILEGPAAQVIDKRLRARFDQAKSVRPEASRPGTRERYLLARGYRGGDEDGATAPPKRGKTPDAREP
jgi:23S rRNA (uridine2552-2'-O)-methyltransferase